MPASEAPPVTCTRRRILGWSTAGALGGLACYFGWPKDGGGVSTANRTTRGTRPADAAPETTQAEAPAPGDMLRRDDFLPYLKSVFRLDDGSECTLVEVGAAQKQVAPTAEFTSFSLLFSAPAHLSAESRIHQLSHGKLGTLDLFLSPVGQSKEHVYLEAVFSQRV